MSISYLKRRIFKRIKQKYPIEIYINGKLTIAGSGNIRKYLEGQYESVIEIDRFTK